MALIRVLATAMLISTFLVPVISSAESAEFDQYFQGALTVYSQFKEPSKEESEEFFAFIKTKWTYETCDRACSNEGVKAGHEYVYVKNIPLDSSN